MSIEPLKYLQNNNSNLVLKSLIEDLELSRRPYNCLKEADIDTLDDLLKYSANELLKLNNFGKRSLMEVCNKLQTKFNLKLRETSRIP
jgi:DNA-directed RNA polymerase subunit alpha